VKQVNQDISPAVNMHNIHSNTWCCRLFILLGWKTTLVVLLQLKIILCAAA